MDNFSWASEETEGEFYEVFNKKSFPISIKFQFISNSKQKNLIKIKKNPDEYVFITGKELLVSFNEELMDAYDAESVTILIEQEIDKINMNLDSGKIKLVKTDLNTFSAIVNKYGVDKVARANKVEELYQDQKKDASDEQFIV